MSHISHKTRRTVNRIIAFLQSSFAHKKAAQRRALVVWPGLSTRLCAIVPALAFIGCHQAGLGADAQRGKELLWQYGCGACHEIPEVKGATGKVGPPLDKMAHQVYIAGVLPNTFENLVYWIREPHKVDPLTAMPDLGVTDEQARDMAAFLYRKKGEK